MRWFASLAPQIGEAREEMAALLNVPRGNLAFVLNASAGASVVFQALMDRGPVDVMVTNHGYGAVTMGAERVARRTGGTATTVSIPLAATGPEAFALVAEAMEQTRPTLLVIDQVTSATAREFPVDDICRRARELGVLTLVDGAHAPGVMSDPICREADYWWVTSTSSSARPGAPPSSSRGGRAGALPRHRLLGRAAPLPAALRPLGHLRRHPWLTAPSRGAISTRPSGGTPSAPPPRRCSPRVAPSSPTHSTGSSRCLSPMSARASDR
ncbi:aminotransferase class V-fold PLP-dependent enzyme [Tessaracoccus coleopterorum]|uniref:aminotransferase class V-fold PLP-dependent enzyme n=1 Tax=Tessaracoccus coleopterorum TaxID=2714950 RepID=UPI0018D48C9B